MVKTLFFNYFSCPFPVFIHCLLWKDMLVTLHIGYYISSEICMADKHGMHAALPVVGEFYFTK